MNFYMLVEGNKTEIEFYPKLFQYYKPEYSEVKYLSDIKQNNYYMFPGGGMPDIKNRIKPALLDILKFNNQDLFHINYLVIVIDGDRFDKLSSAKQSINDVLKKQQDLIAGIKPLLIIQNKCIESWFLANKNLFPTSYDNEFAKLVSIYDIRTSDPEYLPKIDNMSYGKSAKYYLRKMLKQSGRYYSESYLDDVLQKNCIQTIEKQCREIGYIQSFKSVLDFIEIL